MKTEKREQEPAHARARISSTCRFGNHSVHNHGSTIMLRRPRRRQSGNANTQISNISSANPLRIPYICRLQVGSRVIVRIGGLIFHGAQFGSSGSRNQNRPIAAPPRSRAHRAWQIRGTMKATRMLLWSENKSHNGWADGPTEDRSHQQGRPPVFVYRPSCLMLRAKMVGKHDRIEKKPIRTTAHQGSPRRSREEPRGDRSESRAQTMKAALAAGHAPS